MIKEVFTTIEDYDKVISRKEKSKLYMVQPCPKFFGNSSEEQLKHISSEVAEAWEALSLLRSCHGDEKIKEYLRYKLSLELVDIQSAVETELQILNYSPEERLQLHHEVNKKNRERGYWEE